MTNQSEASHSDPKRRFWKLHIRAWKKSGYSQREYCRHHDLVPHRFTYWKLKFEKAVKSAVAFVPVPLPSPNLLENHKAGTFMVRIQQNRFQVEVDDNFSPAPLAQLIRTLEAL